MFQLDGDIVNLLEGLRRKEIGGAVIRFQDTFVLGGDNGRELGQVANHQQLHATKGLVVFTETPEHGIDGIEQIGTYHRYLVDNQQIYRGDDLAFLTTEIKLVFHLGARYIGRKGQLEEGVDGDAPGIDGCHTRWRHHDGALPGACHHLLQERRLARSCLTSQKNAAPRVLDEVPRGAQHSRRIVGSS